MARGGGRAGLPTPAPTLLHPASPSSTIAGAASLWVHDGRNWLLLAAMVWMLTALMILPDNFEYENLTTSLAPSSGSAVSRLLWLGLLGLGATIVIWRVALAWLLVRWLNPFLLAFVVLAILSTAWSINPSLTLRRDIRVLTILLDSAAFVLMGWHARRFENVVRPIITIMLFGSLLFGLAAPSLAIHSESSAELAGAWRGLTNHKNSLGALACIGVIFWVHALLVNEGKRILALLGTAVAVACLLLSRSSTSLVTTVFAVLFLLMLLRSPRGLHRYMPFLVGLFVVALLTYSLAILRLLPGLDALLTPIVMFTGKDMTFTGRSTIWAIMSEHIALHPFLGVGYGAYWSDPSVGMPDYEMIERLHFYPGSAHNGYLEVVSDLGFVGLLCLIGYVITYVRQALHLLRSDRGQGALYLGLFLQQGITNLSETHWFSVMSVNFVIMTLATATLGRTLLEQRLRSYFGEPQRRIRGMTVRVVVPKRGVPLGAGHASGA